MKKLLLLPPLFVLFTGCEKNLDCQNSTTVQKQDSSSQSSATGCPNSPTDPKPEPLPQEPDPDPVPTPPTPVPGSDVPNEALIFDVNLQLFNFEEEDEAKVTKAIEIIKKVIASQEFKDKVLNFTYNGKKQFVDNMGLTNAQIYQKLLDGKEELRPQKDNEMDLELELYYARSSTVGYTTPGELRIYMNTNFFYYYTPAEVAGNVFHEWTHKLGFDHASSYSVSRDYSVPYGIGYIVRDMGKKYGND